MTMSASQAMFEKGFQNLRRQTAAATAAKPVHATTGCVADSGRVAGTSWEAACDLVEGLDGSGRALRERRGFADNSLSQSTKVGSLKHRPEGRSTA